MKITIITSRFHEKGKCEEKKDENGLLISKTFSKNSSISLNPNCIEFFSIFF